MEYSLDHPTNHHGKIDTIDEVTISRVYFLKQKEFLLEFQRRIRNMSPEIHDELLNKLNNQESIPFENDFNY